MRVVLLLMSIDALLNFDFVVRGLLPINVIYLHPLLTQDVVLTSIQRHLTVIMDARWALKQRCVLTGI